MQEQKEYGTEKGGRKSRLGRQIWRILDAPANRVAARLIFPLMGGIVNNADRAKVSQSGNNSCAHTNSKSNITDDEYYSVHWDSPDF